MSSFSSLTVGPNGPVLLQDTGLIEELAHFGRERIPERVVHAKGAGAFGDFTLTHPENINKLCYNSLFHQPKGTKTPVAVRFSTVAGERGSADTVRDPRGFAIKFYTKEGNWDLVCNNTPIFFINDPMLFPSMVHSQKRNPQTNLRDPNSYWDFISQRPESLHQVCLLFSERGIPDGYRHMNGYSGHAFKLIADPKDREVTYVKFHFKTQQGIKNLDSRLAAEKCGTDPDYSTRDLYAAIERGQFPKWTVCIQTMTTKEAKEADFNPFDLTHTWSHKQFPLKQIGILELNKNATNYFAEIEQLAFCPGNLIVGIEPSPDKVLQGRIFSYTDSQRYRLGINFDQLKVNKPLCPYRTVTYRDGAGCCGDNGGNKVNYFPNRFDAPKQGAVVMKHHTVTPFELSGGVDRYEGSNEGLWKQIDDFVYRVLSAESRAALLDNLATNLRQLEPEIRSKMLGHFGNMRDDFYQKLEKISKPHKDAVNGV